MATEHTGRDEMSSEGARLNLVEIRKRELRGRCEDSIGGLLVDEPERDHRILQRKAGHERVLARPLERCSRHDVLTNERLAECPENPSR